MILSYVQTRFMVLLIRVLNGLVSPRVEPEELQSLLDSCVPVVLDLIVGSAREM